MGIIERINSEALAFYGVFDFVVIFHVIKRDVVGYSISYESIYRVNREVVGIELKSLPRSVISKLFGHCWRNYALGKNGECNLSYNGLACLEGRLVFLRRPFCIECEIVKASLIDLGDFITVAKLIQIPTVKYIMRVRRLRQGDRAFNSIAVYFFALCAAKV